MAEIKPGAKVRMRDGIATIAFDFSTHPGASFQRLAKAVDGLEGCVIVAEMDFRQIRENPELTPLGRRARFAEYIRESGAIAYGETREALRLARDRITELRGKMRGSAVDKTDLAGALLRQEIRGWLRSLDDAKRTAIVRSMEPIDPDIALAIAESPAVLSGVTPEQKQSLLDASIAANHPREAHQIDDLERAVEAVESHVRYATKKFERLAEISESELGELVGEPTPSIREFIAERLSEAA
jgi:hypothetical protein